MDKQEFLKELTRLLQFLFADRNYKNPQGKAEIWADILLEDVNKGSYSYEEILWAVNDLLRSDKSFVNIGDVFKRLNQLKEIKLSS